MATTYFIKSLFCIPPFLPQLFFLLLKDRGDIHESRRLQVHLETYLWLEGIQSLLHPSRDCLLGVQSGDNRVSRLFPQENQSHLSTTQSNILLFTLFHNANVANPVCLAISQLHSLEHVHHNRSIGSVYLHDFLLHLLGVSLHVSIAAFKMNLDSMSRIKYILLFISLSLFFPFFFRQIMGSESVISSSSHMPFD